MKKKIISIVLAGSLSALTFTAFSQKDSSGIYMTANDFKNKNLSFAVNSKTEKHKINADIFLNDEDIKVKHHDTTYTFKKSEVYGYKTLAGKTIRLYDNKELEVLNPDEQILIYKYTITTQQPKATPVVMVRYFFTRDAANPPVELTKDNLKKASPENHKFHDALDENFKTDEELISYDKFHHAYKLNWLLQETTK